MNPQKTTIYRIFSALFFFWALCACEKNDDGPQFSLPPATQTGENTFGCLIDGQLLIPRDGSGTFNSPDYAMIVWAYGNPPDYDYIEIEVDDFKGEKGLGLVLHIEDLHDKGEGSFVINNGNCETGTDAVESINIRCSLFDESEQKFKYYCSIANGGKLVITRYDFGNRIVSGTFNCIAVNEKDPLDTIEITKGRFDIKWDRLPTNFP